MADWLFVYGTLRASSAHPMARMLASRAQMLGEARTPGRLYDLGSYPAMKPPAASGEWVYGDLYDLTRSETLLSELDRYEGGEYERCRAEVMFDNGESGHAWVYVYLPSVDEARRIWSGKYGKAP